MPPADPRLSLLRSQQQGLAPTQPRKRTSRRRDPSRPTQPRNYRRSCGEDFTSTRLFDEHRVGKNDYLYDPWDESKADGRRCLNTEEMIAKGWKQNEGGYWGSPERAADVRRRLGHDGARAKALQGEDEGVVTLQHLRRPTDEYRGSPRKTYAEILADKRHAKTEAA
jgi:hypothetical protein